MLTEPEIERRLPVWHALSDLFLDTELQPADYARIAAALRASGFERAELRAILAEEVAPAFVGNLMDVAGEWAGWSAEQVREIMLRSIGARGGAAPLGWFARRNFRRYLDEEWAKLEALLDDG